jgi:hypothetical protein
MYLALEHVPRHRAADQGSGDIIQEARQHEYNREQSQAATPAVWQICRHCVGDSTLLEVTRQDGEAHQQQEQVGENDPFMVKLQHKAVETRALAEAREQKLVDRNSGKTSQRHFKRLVVKHSDAEQRQAEQNEINRDAKQIDWLC